MARAGYCTRCHRDEPITHAEVDEARGYWSDKQELVRYELQGLDAEPCGEDCYLAPILDLVPRVMQQHRRACSDGGG